MAQVRNCCAASPSHCSSRPAAVLSGLDGAMHGLAVDVFATAVLAQIEQGQLDAEHGRRTLRWSNAGHPPPVLLGPDGVARVLDTPPDLLLGLNAGRRADHTVTLEPGTSVIFYTDGLVERRGVALQDGIAWLTRVVGGRLGISAEGICDLLIDQLDGTEVEDDVALLVLKAHPDDEPRAGLRRARGAARRPAGHHRALEVVRGAVAAQHRLDPPVGQRRGLGRGDEVAQHRDEALGVVVEREVPGAGEHLEAAVGHQLVRAAPMGERDDGVLLAPDEHRGHLGREVEAVRGRRRAGRGGR